MPRIPDIVDNIMKEDEVEKRFSRVEKPEFEIDENGNVEFKPIKRKVWTTSGTRILSISHADKINLEDVRVEVIKVRTIEEQVHDMISAGVNLNQIRQDMLSHDYRERELESGLDDGREAFDYSEHKDIFTALDRFKNFFGRLFGRKDQKKSVAPKNAPVETSKGQEPNKETPKPENASKPQETA